MTVQLIERIFGTQTAKPHQEEHLDAIRIAAERFAGIVYLNTPQGSGQTAAIRKIHEASMTACKTVLLDGSF